MMEKGNVLKKLDNAVRKVIPSFHPLRVILYHFLHRQLRPNYYRPGLDSDLTLREHLVKAPPFTDEFVRAIRLVCSHYRLTATEQSRSLWEAEQNGTCWGEFEVLEPVLRSIPKPRNVLEIGPGMGRSIVFFKRSLQWEDVEFHVYEGNGSRVRYGKMTPKDDQSFCGNIPFLRSVLEYNNIRAYKIFEAPACGFDLRSLPGPYDLVYSLYSVGYHWALEDYLDEILAITHPRSLAFFTVGDTFTPFARLEQFQYQLLEVRTGDLRRERLLVLNPASAK